MKRQTIKTKGIILGSKTIGEKDKYVFIYAKNIGKIKAVALGALNPSSKFTGALETLNYCAFDIYQGPKSAIITEVKVEKNYKNIRKDLKKITNGFLVVKIVNDLTQEHHQIPGLLDLIDESLQEIAGADKEEKFLLTSLSFIVKFLDMLGLLPDFKHHEFKQSEYHSRHLEKKYLKLLNFLNKNPIHSNDKISLSKEETLVVKDIIKDIIEMETDRELNLPL